MYLHNVIRSLLDIPFQQNLTNTLYSLGYLFHFEFPNSSTQAVPPKLRVQLSINVVLL